MLVEKKQSLIKILTDYLKERAGERIHGGELEDVARAHGYEGETAKRRLREMTQYKHKNYNPNIKKDIQKGCVVYWYASYVPVEVSNPGARVEKFVSNSQPGVTYQTVDFGTSFHCECKAFQYRGWCKHTEMMAKKASEKMQFKLPI